MSAEFHQMHEHEPGNDFNLALITLREHFEDALLEQQELENTEYRIFTIVEKNSNRSHDLARFRLVDGSLARVNLQNASSTYIDIALPVESANTIDPKLIASPEGDYFVYYERKHLDREQQVVVTKLNYDGFEREHPHFFSRVMQFEIVPSRKG